MSAVQICYHQTQEPPRPFCEDVLLCLQPTQWLLQLQDPEESRS